MENMSGWANYPVVKGDLITPPNRAALCQYVVENEGVIARGNGKSYGDAAIGGKVISTLALRQMVHFNTQEGILECESGMLLSDLLPTIIAAGWFFHVTPGIKHITVGGAIASDVHGKNHPTKGCFSNWLISFELLTGSGEIVTCSRQENTTLFWQTCGGMGWTGILLSARFQLMRISNTQVLQKTVQCQHLEEIFQTFESNRDASYAAAWIDTTAIGKAFGRGAVHLAEHIEEPSPLVWRDKNAKNIPFFAPSWLLNPMSIHAFNTLYFRKNHSGSSVTSLDGYFYPLDALNNWNRLYGRRGFVQYQFCLPDKNAFVGIQKLLEMVASSAETPFLSVLKRHGERPPEAVHSFPVKGYSLALDFPRTRTIFDLVKKMDDLVWDFGGKIYLTKDACSDPKMGRIDPTTFGDAKFSSALRERISRVSVFHAKTPSR